MPEDNLNLRQPMTELDKTPIQSPEVEDAPLVDWANPPTLADLKRNYEDAKSDRDTQVMKIDGYLANLHITGNAVVKTPEGSSKVQPKLIRKQAEWRYPALSEPFLSTSDVFNVKPVTWEDRDAARQNQMVLNNQFNTKLNKVAFIDEYVRASVEEGTVTIKVAWVTNTEEYTAQEPVVQFQFDQSFMPVLQQVDMLKHTSPSQFDTDVPEEVKQAYELSMQKGQPYRPIITGYEEVTKTRQTKNQPTVEVCDYRNIMIDPTAKGKIEDAKFIIYSFETSMSELKKDGRYKNLDKVDTSNASPLAQPDHASGVITSNFQFGDKPRAKIVVYEYWGFWDIDGSGIVKSIVAAWIGNQLIRMEENPYPDKALPFVNVQYLPVRRSNFGEPDGALLEDNQKIIGAVTRGMIDLMAKSANAQTGTRKDFLDFANQRKFEKGQDYQYNPGANPQEAVYQHKFPEIPQSAPLMLQMQNAEAESLTGVKSFSNGVSGNSLGDVAAGVRGALDSSSKRETSILRRLAQGMIEVGRKIIAMNAVFLSEEEVIRITNEEFVKVKRDDLAGNFDLELSISTAEEDDNKAKELAFMLQTVGPNEDPKVRTMILADICKLRKMPDLAHKLETYEPQPNPFQQQMQQLELAEKQAQINLLNAQAAAAGSNAQLHQAKVGTEGAKQGHINADTDQKNLNFVEQESGVTQERELQKQREAGAQQSALQSQSFAEKQADKASDQLHEAGMARLQHHLDKKLPAPQQ